MKNLILLLCCLSLVACAQREDDDGAGDDDVTDPDPDPTPDPAACDDASDCEAVDGCSDAVCVAGACSSEPACDADEVCDEDLDACVEVTTPTPGNGTVTCTEDGALTKVKISGGILAHLYEDALTPTSAWSIRFGYGGTSSVSWVSDASNYVLTMPNTVAEFNFVLRNASGTEYWFDSHEFDASGTCGKKGDGAAFTHVAATVDTYGTLTCEMTTETGSLKRRVTIKANAGRDIRDALAEGPAPLPSPSVIQYGGSDGWTLPYAGGIKPQLTWTNGTASYVFYLDPAVDDFNFFVVDNDDPTDSWGGGDFFLLDKWSIVNVGSAGCNRVGGGVSIN